MEAIIVIAIFAIITVVLLIAIWRALSRRAHPASKRPTSSLDKIPAQTREPEDGPIFRIGLWLLIIASILLTMIPDARGADTAPQKPQRIVLNLADCPPPGPDMTPIVVFIVNTRADGGPMQSRCTRVAMRNYQSTRPQKPMTRTNNPKE